MLCREFKESITGCFATIFVVSMAEHTLVSVIFLHMTNKFFNEIRSLCQRLVGH